MKKLLFGIILGFALAISPDLIQIVIDHLETPYQHEGCKGFTPDTCQWDQNGWYTKFTKDYPKLTQVGYYFQLGEGPLYWALTGRCNNQKFHNPSAAGKDSGKITNRDYFYSRCSQLSKDISDLIYRDGDAE